MLSKLIEQEQKQHGGGGGKDGKVQSLLQNDLGVALPLHVSLSRPLVLKTEHKEGFLNQLKQAISRGGVRAFTSKPDALAWHPNEISTRWFLVLRLQRPEKDELSKLLSACNEVAEAFKQPLLYVADRPKMSSTTTNAEANPAGDDKFHISIAWSLKQPAVGDDTDTSTRDFAALKVPFSEVKVRIGQDVTTLPLPARRSSKKLFG